MTDKPERPPHILSIGERAGESLDHYYPSCSCGWESYVICPTEQLAVEQLRKHADRVFRRSATLVNLSIRIDAGHQSPDNVKELIAIAKKEASKG